MKQGKTETVRREAIEQTEAGAEILDVNVGVPTIDERQTMIQVIQSIQTLVDTPLMIDSTDPAVLDHALKLYPGKALVNSVNGEDASLDTILPLVKRYGAAVVGLTLDERGIPKTAEERFQVAEKIVKRAEEYGIPKQDVIIDCLVLTASAQPEGIAETLKSITFVKERLQISTILGVSNVSFGLPNRKAINPVFLSMALAAGLDAAIMNPLDDQMVNTMKIGGVLTNRDKHAEAYISFAKERLNESSEKIFRKDTSQKEPKDIFEALYQIVLAGDKERVVPLLEKGLEDGKDPMELLNQGLIPGIEEVGRLFGNGTYFLPQLIQAGDTMTTSFERLRPELAKQSTETVGTIVMATVKGDIHDIGKSIVSVLLSNHRFKVIDLGKNVPNEVVIQRAIEEKADIIGLSALMTTTMVRMREVVQMVKEQNLPFQVIVGGAAVNEQYAKEIGAAGYAKDAVKAVEVAKALLQERSVS
ncbi:dihydropteroate synthase [Tepidibacillus marianensis]|uniref:dihydropteroate synthase n=1 Tax=Tepidibacillus marianensis TaxID=3131995 RepID=UPI0030CA9A07